MEIKDFVQNFADQFDDTEADLLRPGQSSENWKSGVH